MTNEKPEILTREQVLELLSKEAADGSVSAMTWLERALRHEGHDDDEIGAERDRLIRGSD